MNHSDPCYPKIQQATQFDRELTVEEVAAIEKYNQERDVFPELSRSEVRTEAVTNEALLREPQNQVTSNESLKGDAVASESIDELQLRTIYRKVSGRYSNCPRSWKLELRVDVDSYRPTKMVSGDYYYVSGSTTSYFGSFKVEAPSIYVSSTQVTIIGIAQMTWSTPYQKVRLVIPRHNIFQPAANAYVQWYTLTNQKGADYVCLFDSPYFRTIQLEEDRETGVTAFTSYNTGALPSGGTSRTLTIGKAYAEAGIEVQSSINANVIPTSEADSDHKWNNAELHDAMEKHFSLWQNQPQWKVWLFHANAHEYGAGLLGIMFDQKDRQRQGCASFYQAIDSNTATDQRTQLYVNVHELGHCFNLFHSFHKKYMNPPLPNRPDSLSWMNYPTMYTGGSSAFWNNFDFQFDDLELRHLRHAYRNDIIIGGNPFGEGAAAEGHNSFMDNVRDQTGLRLSLVAPKYVSLGTPIHVGIQLTNETREPKEVAVELHPNCGLVQIALQKPNGQVITYHPPMSYLVIPKTRYLAPGESIEESAYIGFDNEDGQVFDMPGNYKLFATYYTPEGSAIRSEVSSMSISAPRDVEEETLAELLLGREQGMLFFLEGSYSESLRKGNAAFEEILDRFGEHPLANHVRYCEGMKKRRTFLQVDTQQKLTMQKQNKVESEKLLKVVASAKPADLGFTPQVFDRVKSHIADVKETEKDTSKAKGKLKRTA